MWMFKHWTQTNSWKWCSRFGEQHAKGAIFYAICTFVEFTMKPIYFLRIHFRFCVLVSLSVCTLLRWRWCTFLIVFRILWIDRYAFSFAGIAFIHLTILFFLSSYFCSRFYLPFYMSLGARFVCVCVSFSFIPKLNQKIFFATRFYFIAGFAGYCKIHLDLSVDTSNIHTTGNKLEANRRIVNRWRKKSNKRSTSTRKNTATHKYIIYKISMSISRTKWFFLFVIAVFRFDSFFFRFGFLALFFSFSSFFCTERYLLLNTVCRWCELKAGVLWFRKGILSFCFVVGSSCFLFYDFIFCCS